MPSDTQNARQNSRLEVDDEQFCKDCGMEIEVDVASWDGMAWDDRTEEWVEIEHCASCAAEQALKELSHVYGTDVAFRATVRGLDIETELIE